MNLDRLSFRHVQGACSALALTFVAVLPVTLTIDLWKQIYVGLRPQSWDGSGHYALASIYSESIFPDTFGWTHAYFGGMPFPNFYPPLFYWCVGFLHHTGCLSFAASFKSVLVLSVVLLPVAIWILAWGLGDGDRIFATAAALACVPIMLDYRLRLVLFPSGLDYVSNFQVGLYTQPLGFILLAAWLVIYIRTSKKGWHLPLASVLLALTVLANFFNAVTATIFIAATLIANLLLHKELPGVKTRDRLRVQLASPFLAAGLVLFWIVPMISEYRYFVTRPLPGSVFDYVPPAMWWWYALPMLGFVLWLLRPTTGFLPYLIGCLILEVAIIFSSQFAPGWVPFQPLRFLSTLNMLLAVPAGYVVAAIIRAFAHLCLRVIAWIRSLRHRPALGAHAATVMKSAISIAALLLLSLGIVLFVELPYYTGSFAVSPNDRIDPVLSFASSHRDGRYLVEHSMYTYPGSASDVRALMSYLGAQGNDSVSVVFREASPNSIFFNTLVGALSTFTDSFGISSVLVEDLDFTQQPVAKHLDRARFIGVKYIVAASSRVKKILSEEPLITTRHDFGTWSVFELQEQPLPRAQFLPYKPALVLSTLSLKQRKRNEFDFVRFAEEQFVDDWFDVLLAWSNESKIDRIPELDRFGALIVENYDYGNEDSAFEKLRSFAQTRPLILFSANNPLFLRIRTTLAEFPHAIIIERSSGEPPEWLVSEGANRRYNESVVRKQWQQIRGVIENEKISTGFSRELAVDIKPKAIELDLPEPAGDGVPVLIRTSYHPNWRRTDGIPVYPVTPFFMLTFIKDDTRIVYGRSWYDRIALYSSATLFGLVCLLTISSLQRSSWIYPVSLKVWRGRRSIQHGSR